MYLKKINTDWSKWDDTYEFIEGDDKGRENFIKINLYSGILSDLNFIIFQDDHGKILYQQDYDDLSEKKNSRGKIEMIAKKISDYTEKTGMLVGEGKEAIVFSNLKISDSKNVKKYVVLLIVNFIILVFYIYIFMEQIIVKRLRKMDHSVREIIECQDLGERLRTKGKDEIGNSGKNINVLLVDIEVRKERLYDLATYDVMTGILNRHMGFEKNSKNYDKESKKEYTHSISIGVVECRENKTLDEYVNIADINMYKNKRHKKKFLERIYVEKN